MRATRHANRTWILKACAFEPHSSYMQEEGAAGEVGRTALVERLKRKFRFQVCHATIDNLHEVRAVQLK